MTSGDTNTTTDEPTRRDYVKYGGALAAGCGVAGCSDILGQGKTPNASGQSEGGSYSVTMEPVGTLEFDSVPESIAPFTADYADMLMALGQADAIESIWLPARYKTVHYDDLDGVSMDPNELTQLYDDGVSKETFYEMNADLHLIDPHAVTDWFNEWDQRDLEEIRDRVAPFIGNVIFRRTDSWHDYRYYSLYDAFEKVAEIVRERERFEAIKSMHEDLVADVQARLPAPDDRPNAALVWGGEQPDVFYPYRLSGNGANKEHFHTIGLSDAFAGTGINGLSTSDTGSIDYETLLEVDPDSLLVRVHGEGLTSEQFETRVVDHIRNHPVGSELTAVKNDRVLQGGPIYAGPLHNLFMIEYYAKGFFPEEFTEAELFDHDELARIVTDGASQ